MVSPNQSTKSLSDRDETPQASDVTSTRQNPRRSSSESRQRVRLGRSRERQRVRFFPGSESTDESEDDRPPTGLSEKAKGKRPEKPPPLPRIKLADQETPTNTDFSTTGGIPHAPARSPTAISPDPPLATFSSSDEENKDIGTASYKREELDADASHEILAQASALESADKDSLVQEKRLDRPSPVSVPPSPSTSRPDSSLTSLASTLDSSLPMKSLLGRTRQDPQRKNRDDTIPEIPEIPDIPEELEGLYLRFEKALENTNNKWRAIFRLPPVEGKDMWLTRFWRAISRSQAGKGKGKEKLDPDFYLPEPKHYREGFLTQCLKLLSESTLKETLGASPPTSGANSPKREVPKWYRNQKSTSQGSIAGLVSSSTIFAQIGSGKVSPDQSPAIRPASFSRPSSTGALDAFFKPKKDRLPEAIPVAKALYEETAKRTGFILKFCRALMAYGAPTHRLEEYLRFLSVCLRIEAQFLHIPGCMLVSFDDSTSHTAQVSIVRVRHGVDLGKLKDIHDVYKLVIHDVVSLDEAISDLDAILQRPPKYRPWTMVFVYGVASASVGPFAFGARWVDLPAAFGLGSFLGIMQLIISPRSELYSNIFEISAAVATSFLARCAGSAYHGSVFCFSALAQSAICLILPGFIVLSGALELQSKNIVAGAIHIVNAVIFCLFLGYGITVGSAVYGSIDSGATSAVTCVNPMNPYVQWIFVPIFTVCLVIINQGRWSQMPVMVILSFIGFVTNHFSSRWFKHNAQIANTLGALVIGILGNIYSRFGRGVAAAALLPAIFVQVPSGLAAGGSLVSGVVSANQITDQQNSTVLNGTTTVSSASEMGAVGVDVNTTVFNVGYSMIEIAIGITVGLFLSALCVYPFGKKRSGLFSF